MSAEPAFPLITEHIVSTPETRGGRARIAGTRITVGDVVVWHEKVGMDPHEIVARYNHLSLADVHAALAYYYDHEPEIREQIRSDLELDAELRARQPSILEKIRKL